MGSMPPCKNMQKKMIKKEECKYFLALRGKKCEGVIFVFPGDPIPRDEDGLSYVETDWRVATRVADMPIEYLFQLFKEMESSL